MQIKRTPFLALLQAAISYNWQVSNKGGLVDSSRTLNVGLGHVLSLLEGVWKGVPWCAMPVCLSLCRYLSRLENQREEVIRPCRSVAGNALLQHQSPTNPPQIACAPAQVQHTPLAVLAFSAERPSFFFLPVKKTVPTHKQPFV